MGRVSAVLGPFLAFCALAGCGSGHKATSPSTTQTVASTISAPKTTGPATTTAQPTTAPASTTPSTVAPPSVRITSYSISPASPVSCNAPTMVELTWTSVGATTVDLSIDGRLFASYGGGTQKHLEYLACDGEPHTYLLTARSGSTTATSSRIVNTIPG